MAWKRGAKQPRVERQMLLQRLLGLLRSREDISLLSIDCLHGDTTVALQVSDDCIGSS